MSEIYQYIVEGSASDPETIFRIILFYLIFATLIELIISLMGGARK